MLSKSAIAVGGPLLLVLFMWLAAPPLVPRRKSSEVSTCVNNLRQLDGAKQVWALEHHKTTNYCPSLNDLNGYVRRPLICPRGGTYSLGRVDELPKCSIGGAHRLPQ
ncbi:MAG TPA: hypothetical protein VL361_01015 [Candidatus Limnocylindrales bacterium]|nr:hypothetical protein [Candidatus Limnocylindrales bacterium]